MLLYIYVEGDDMTIIAIKEAIKSFKQLYIDSEEVDIVFFDELTETIEIKYKNNDIVTFVTKSSLSEYRKIRNTIRIDEVLILRDREERNV